MKLVYISFALISCVIIQETGGTPSFFKGYHLSMAQRKAIDAYHESVKSWVQKNCVNAAKPKQQRKNRFVKRQSDSSISDMDSSSDGKNAILKKSFFEIFKFFMNYFFKFRFLVRFH